MKKVYLENLKALRIDRDYSQEKIANILGVSQNTYSQYETGVIALPLDYFITLCQFYHVSLDDVAGLTGKRMPLPDTEKDGQ